MSSQLKPDNEALRMRIPHDVYANWKPDTPCSTSDIDAISGGGLDSESGSLLDTPSEDDDAAYGMLTIVCCSEQKADEGSAPKPKRARSSSDVSVSSVREIRSSKKVKHGT